jgi:pyruvate dehydrogenase E2 component (dihydrolipoamide acetyltransferase)
VKRITVPDIGDFKDVQVVEVLVAVGDKITKDQAIVMLESDKAVMEVPSSDAGVVTDVRVKVGDRVSAGSPLLSIQLATEAAAASSESGKRAAGIPQPEPQELTGLAPAERAVQVASEPHAAQASNVIAFIPSVARNPDERVYAGPAVRKLARELGVNLLEVKGSGRRGRIVPQDVRAHVRTALSKGVAGAAVTENRWPFEVAPWPKIDYGKFGPIEVTALSRIRKISGANLHRNWISIPHVTNHGDADVTEMEAFRSEMNRELESKGTKISPLAFIVKACVVVLKRLPEFNSSLDEQNLVLKRYYHIGFAVDTPNGLLVPVIRDADQKGIVQIASEIAELSVKAREGKLASADMQGGTFSISSLGGIGGSYFTPIINAPEVAILGIGRMQTRVVWEDGQPKPRIYLPLSLSWDHRVVDGAAAGRFIARLEELLGDVRRLLL